MKTRRNITYIAIGVSLFLVLLLLGALFCKDFGKEESDKDYGVFLSLDASHLEEIAEYGIVVIDVQYFSEKDIALLKERGCTVYSYLNAGSLENFRDYYEEYEYLILGDYENWEEEKWVDVSRSQWQSFVTSLAEEFIKKGIDGFFVDNCDVYYQYPTDGIFDGLTAILTKLMAYEKSVIINGGDTFVLEYRQRHGTLTDIITGVNQECVWSGIDFSSGKFFAQEQTDREYFQNYVETCDGDGLDVYLLEYTDSEELKKEIRDYCRKNNFHVYMADSIELD